MKAKTLSTKNMNKDVSVLEKYIQVVSSDLLAALKQSAAKNGISLDIEVAARLNACMAEPMLTKDNKLSEKIMRLKFTHKEAVAECNRKREATQYIYEMERLKLFLRFENILPRHIKEIYKLIDVKEATKKIRAELDAESLTEGPQDSQKD